MRIIDSLRTPHSAFRIPDPRVSASPRPRVTSRGFTLLEVLLALSLSVVLLTAVYGAFDLYLRLASSSNDDIEQAQVARALLRKMAIDIRSVVNRPPSTASSVGGTKGSSGSQGAGGGGTAGSGSSGGSGKSSSASSGSKGSSSKGSGASSGSSGSKSSSASSGSSDANALEPAVVDPSAGFSAAMTGLIGDSETLVLHVVRGFRQRTGAIDPEAEQVVGVNSGQERSISYFLADSGATGLAGYVGDAHKDDGSTGDIHGLARLEGNRLLIHLSDEAADLETLAKQTDLLAKEVVGLQFRYFDGVDWFDAWDPALNSGLPQAVEITLKLKSAQTGLRSASSSRDAEPITKFYTLSVAVPSAKPYVPAAE